MAKLYIVGSTNQDIVCTMDKFPETGETLHGRELHFFQGGKGANQAIAASKMGADANFTTMVGNDAFGKDLKSYLEATELETSIFVSEKNPTGTAIINVDKNGNNNIVIISGANEELSMDQVYIDGNEGDILLIQNELSEKILKKLLLIGKKKKMVTILNCAPAIDITENINLIDYLIVNEHELAVSLNVEEIDTDNIEKFKAYVKFLADKFEIDLIVTIGKKGVVANIDKAEHYINGHKVNVLDTTGAGDCFCGSFASCLSMGMDVSMALTLANIAASISVQDFGASASYPDFETIKERIKNEQ